MTKIAMDKNYFNNFIWQSFMLFHQNLARFFRGDVLVNTGKWRTVMDPKSSRALHAQVSKRTQRAWCLQKPKQKKRALIIAKYTYSMVIASDCHWKQMNKTYLSPANNKQMYIFQFLMKTLREWTLLIWHILCNQRVVMQMPGGIWLVI